MKKYLLFTLAVLFLAGCSSSKESGNNNTPILNYTITLTESGGFTGRASGYIIDSTGGISSFEGFASNRTTKSTGRLSGEQITEINRLAKTISDITYRENGNMTASILLKNYNEELRFSWSGVQPGASVPKELIEFYNLVNNSIHNPKGI